MSLATVQRLRRDRDGVPCLPFMEHRTRDSRVLIPGTEWGWSTDPREAFLFLQRDLPAVRSRDDWETSAAAHVARLKDEGDTHMIAVCDYGVPGAQERALRQQSRMAQTVASVREEGLLPLDAPAAAKPVRRQRHARRPRRSALPPAEVYEETSRRLGEHEP